MIPRKSFGRTGLSVSVVGFGAAPIAYLQSEQDQSVKVIESLLAGGVNLIDTAASYPGSEEFLGKHFSARRSDLVLVSKCGQKIPESRATDWSAELIAASVDRSLKLLRTDHLDVMLLHSCNLDVLKKGEAMGALVRAREAGKTRFIGYSGDNEAAAYAAQLAQTDVIETSINIVDQINLQKALPIAKRNNLGVIAKRPVANAAWKDLSDQPGMYQSYAKPYTDRLRQMKISPESIGFKSSTGATGSEAWAELALRFTLSFEVHTAIIGTTRPQNAAKNLRYAQAGPLPSDVVEKIQSAFARHSNDQWLGQT